MNTYPSSPGQTIEVSLPCGCTSQSLVTWNIYSATSGFFQSFSLEYSTTSGTTPNNLTVTLGAYDQFGSSGTIIVQDTVSTNGSVSVGSQYVTFDVVPNAPQSNASKIFSAENVYQIHHQAQYSTRGTYGASTGNECVATVQALLNGGGFPFVGGSIPGRPTTPALLNVDPFRAALKADTKDWQSVTQGAAVKGDIWVEGDGQPAGGQQHVGICITNGCTLVESNSSGNGSFTWQATPAAYQSYYVSRGDPNLPGGYWHHK